MLRKSIIAIDIGTYSIKIIEGDRNINMVQINKAVTIPTPSDTFYNGEIMDNIKIERAISEILKEENIKTKNVAFTLESTDAINREIVLPRVKPQDLVQMVGFEVEQYLPVELDKYILQYKIINEFEEGNMKKVTVLVVALPKSISEGYLNLSKNMGLTPCYLDTHFNALHKLLTPKILVNDSYSLEDQTIAAIDLGHQFINITIINRGQLEFSRLLNNGGKDIDTNIADMLNLSLEEAEIRKREIKNINNDTENDLIVLIGIAEEVIMGWLEEIQKIFMYYTSRKANNVIDSIYIYGGGSNIGGISTYIREFFDIPVLKINSLNNVKSNSNLEGSSVLNYINAAGAIIRK